MRSPLHTLASKWITDMESGADATASTAELKERFRYSTGQVIRVGTKYVFVSRLDVRFTEPTTPNFAY